MKILFLDDDWTRHQSFKRQYAHLTPPNALFPVYTGEQARDTMIAVPCFDALFLDHDLGEVLSEDGKPGTWSGTEFVDWLVGAPVVLPKKIVIHSWNRYGANRMATTLIQRRGASPRRVPFSDHLLTEVGIDWLVRT